MKKINFLVISVENAAIFLLFVIISGCSNHVSPQAGNLSLSFAPGTAMAKTSSDSVIITSAKILIKDLKLKGNYTDSTKSKDTNDEQGDDEVELKAGPFVVSLNLNGMVNTVTVNSVPAGVYYAAKFQVHKIGENEISPDTDFAPAPGQDDGYSVVVKGFFNATPFVYKSRLNADQEVRFQNPVAVKSTSFVNVTLIVNPNSWFYINGEYLDPTNPTNDMMIDQQIRASFGKGFEDDAKDGHED